MSVPPQPRGEASDATPHPVILFDGVCNLCSFAVRFVAARDPEGVFRFASLQSPAGKSLLARAALPTDDLYSIVLVDADGVRTRSDAALAIAARLAGGWATLRYLRIIPRAVRDRVYDLIARYRYRVFGRDDRCIVPSVELRGRILAGGMTNPPE